jgi:pilus assembly protein CpaC
MRSGPALAASALLSAAPLAAQPETTINLGVGQQKVIQVANLARVAIGDPDVADVKQVGGAGELLLTGVGEGRTSLLVWRTHEARLSYAVIVRRQDPRELVSEVRALLGDVEGVQVRVVGDRVVLEGETLTSEDADRVQQVAQLFPPVKSFVRPSGNSRRLAADALNRAYQRSGFRGVQAGVVGSTVVLEGWVESQEDLRKLDLVTRAVGEKAESLVTVGVKRMVLVEVEFVEATAGASKLLGVKPPTTLVSTGPGVTASVNVVQPIPGLDSGQTQKTGSVSVAASAASDFAVGARFDNGVVRVLSQPRLVCASGEKAEFVAGGEIPLPVVTQNQIGVEWKKFGIVLHITPTADRSGNIGTEIYAEVSDIDRTVSVHANGVDVPGFRLRDVRTNVTVHDGETIILSGLYNYSEEKEVSKLPLLGNIPILGELFKSRSFVDRKTELAIYVTPRLISVESGRNREMIDEARKLYQESEKAVSFSVFD